MNKPITDTLKLEYKMVYNTVRINWAYINKLNHLALQRYLKREKDS